jgi:hypothetical protein
MINRSKIARLSGDLDRDFGRCRFIASVLHASRTRTAFLPYFGQIARDVSEGGSLIAQRRMPVRPWAWRDQQIRLMATTCSGR